MNSFTNQKDLEATYALLSLLDSLVLETCQFVRQWTFVMLLKCRLESWKSLCYTDEIWVCKSVHLLCY